eukprot:m.212005 g.212005  ORF g.212005 m.212005 type:complete len:938 (+) comp15844_c0_seq6:264-3077(+)
MTSFLFRKKMKKGITAFIEVSEEEGKAPTPELEEAAAVVDVLANLTAISRAKGELGPDNEGVESPIDAASLIPEKSSVLRQKLGKSVKKGHLNANRALAAAQWVDKEIRKLIAAIKEFGENNNGHWTVTYKALFDNTDDIFEALSGTLKTAKKHKVVKYESEVLFQGRSDDVVITLLKETIPDATIDTYTYRQVRDASRRAPRKPPKTSGFGNASLQGTNSKCFICSKTVYAMEFVGASGKAFHKACFRCKVCNGLLRPDSYATIKDQFYCKTHYEEEYKKAGGYDFGKEDQAMSPIKEEESEEVAPEKRSSVGVAAATLEEVTPSDIKTGQDDPKSPTKVQPVENSVLYRFRKPVKQLFGATGETSNVESTETVDKHKDLKSVGKVLSSLALELEKEKGKPVEGDGLERALELPDDASVLKKKLRQSVKKAGGSLDEEEALSAARFVDSEIRKLIKCMQDIGVQNDEGQYVVKFGALLDKLNDELESLQGTMRTAKKTEVIDYKSRMLMAGVHNDLDIILLKTEIVDADLDTYTFKQVRLVSCRQFKGAAKTPGPMAAALGSELTAAATTPVKVIGTTAEESLSESPPEKQKRASNISLGLKPADIAESTTSPEPGIVVTSASTTIKSGVTTSENAAPAIQVTEEQAEEAVIDVLSNLAILAEDGDGGDKSDDNNESDEEEEAPTTQSSEPIKTPVEAALEVPETSKILSRNLGFSVRRGELSKNRAVMAARWVDKEIRKLIDIILAKGEKKGDIYEILFGKLFVEAEHTMEVSRNKIYKLIFMMVLEEAVAGTLKTAKKHGVVSYEAEILFQGRSDNVVITLLKTTIPDSDVNTYTYRQIRDASRRVKPKKTSGFGGASLQGTNSKCHICGKTVYAMEFIGVSGKAFHKTCFRCKVCNTMLRTDNYATIGGLFYCNPHYQEEYNKAGGYDFEKTN